jgi:hypothetical protein
MRADERKIFAAGVIAKANNKIAVAQTPDQKTMPLKAIGRIPNSPA